MNLARYITEDLVKLEMTTVIEPHENGSIEKWRTSGKARVIEELVGLLESGHRIGNKSKLVTDLMNRERQATTGIGNGIAFPHVRTKQAKDFMIAFARSSVGYDFDSPDGTLSHIFFVMAAPPYDDTLYLKVFKALAEKLQYPELREELMNAQTAGEIIRAIRAAD